MERFILFPLIHLVTYNMWTNYPCFTMGISCPCLKFVNLHFLSKARVGVTRISKKWAQMDVNVTFFLFKARVCVLIFLSLFVKQYKWFIFVFHVRRELISQLGHRFLGYDLCCMDPQFRGKYSSLHYTTIPIAIWYLIPTRRILSFGLWIPVACSPSNRSGKPSRASHICLK